MEFTFAPVPIGASVISMAPLQLGAKTVSGTPNRVSPGNTGTNSSGADIAADTALFNLGFASPDQMGTAEASNYATAGAAEPAAWYVSPSPTVLTFFDGGGAQEVGWSISSPKRTSVAAQPTDKFVRGLVAGSYFGIELVLSFPSDCAVGALSDALGRPAEVRDAVPASGIFAPGVTAAVEKVLVANDVTMQVRVIANEKLPAVEALLASTTCSPSHIAACATLVSALQDAGKTFRSSLGTSDLTKLQADTDPGWSPMHVETAAISIAGP